MHKEASWLCAEVRREDVSGLDFGDVCVLCTGQANPAAQARQRELLPASPVAAFPWATTPMALQESTYEQGYFKFWGSHQAEYPKEWKDLKSMH